ncbi:MAG: hypothetical protein ACLGIO_00770 [Acidimicrobiia bacterium]
MTTDPAAALLGRARLQVAGASEVRLSLDGWPLVAVDLATGQVAVHDLGGAPARRAVAIGPVGAGEELALGAVGDELYLLVGDAACVFVIPAPAPSAHAEVAVVASATGQLLAERRVRYRPDPAAPSPRRPAARR